MSLMRSEIAEMLGSFFAYHGWTIHMDDRAGQPLDPFEVLATMVDHLRQPSRAENAAESQREALDESTVERVMNFLIDLHDCRDPDIGVPCAYHAGERKRAMDAAYEYARADLKEQPR